MLLLSSIDLLGSTAEPKAGAGKWKYEIGGWGRGEGVDCFSDCSDRISTGAPIVTAVCRCVSGVSSFGLASLLLSAIVTFEAPQL